MTIDKALEITEKLEVLAEFPRGAKGRGVVTDILMQTCETDEQAEWLFREICLSGRYSRWGGPGWLREIYETRYHSRNAADAPGGYKTWERPNVAETKVSCTACEDVGYFCGGDGFWTWCLCPEGDREREANPRIIANLNSIGSKPIRPTSERQPLSRITEADFAKAREGK